MTLNKPTLFYLGFVNNQLNLYISIVKIYLENKIGKILHIPKKVVSLQSIKKKNSEGGVWFANGQPVRYIYRRC